jgi:hypothetical protein
MRIDPICFDFIAIIYPPAPLVVLAPSVIASVAQQSMQPHAEGSIAASQRGSSQ